MAKWTCPLDDYPASDENEKREHLMKNADDPGHQQLMKMESQETIGDLNTEEEEY